MAEVPGWSMNLILFCGRTSAPMLAAVCRPMAKPLLQDARFRGEESRGGAWGMYGVSIRCTSGEVS